MSILLYKTVFNWGKENWCLVDLRKYLEYGWRELGRRGFRLNWITLKSLRSDLSMSWEVKKWRLLQVGSVQLSSAAVNPPCNGGVWRARARCTCTHSTTARRATRGRRGQATRSTATRSTTYSVCRTAVTASTCTRTQRWHSADRWWPTGPTSPRPGTCQRDAVHTIDVKNIQIKIKNVKNVKKRDKNKKTFVNVIKQEAQLSPRNRAMRQVS